MSAALAVRVDPPAPPPRPTLARADCGGLHAVVNGTDVLLRCSGALWLADERMLVVADLHLEKGSSYAARGQLLPPYDTRETLARLAAEVAALQPRTVVLLGDTLHDRKAGRRIAAEDAAAVAALARGRTLLWLEGNHDPDGPQGLAGDAAPDLLVRGLHLRHEPTADGRPGEVAGHLHPVARVQGRVGVVRRRCFALAPGRLILPAFGAYAGGLNLRDAAFVPLFGRPPVAATLGTRQVHPIGWRSLIGD